MTVPTRSLADLDPSKLSQQQRQALRTIKNNRCLRRHGGFGRPPHSVSLTIATTLIRLGLARQDYAVAGGPQLVLTGTGQAVLSIMESRIAQRRKA